MTRTDALRLAYFGGVLSKGEFLTCTVRSEHAIAPPRVDLWSHREAG